MANTANSSVTTNLSRAEVARVCGDILDWKIKAIIESGATVAELEAAAAWAAGADEVLGEEREPLTGATAAVYDILTADEEFDEDM
jgi:hypothetical protein